MLASNERDDTARALASLGANVTSWNACGERTYATLTLADDAVPSELERRIGARIDSPALAIVRITPDAPRRLPALERALGGTGRPAGIRDCSRVAASLVIECDTRTTALATLVALVDCELAYAPGRTIEPLVSLDDETLVAFAAALLGEPNLDAERLIEPHLARALAVAAR